MDIRTIKDRAYADLEKRLFGYVWIMLILCGLITSVITSIPNLLSTLISRISPRISALIGVPLLICTFLVSGPMTFGITGIYLRTAQGKNENGKIKISDLFQGFKNNFADSAILYFVRSMFIALWSLLFLIPGIIKAYAYSMAFYIQQENKDKNWRTCLDESAALTDGYKGKLFLLDLSFIGWYILGFLCLFVGVLWVSVYHNMARAEFYEELKRIKLGDDAADDGASDPFASDSSDQKDDDPFFLNDVTEDIKKEDDGFEDTSGYEDDEFAEEEIPSDDDDFSSSDRPEERKSFGDDDE